MKKEKPLVSILLPVYKSELFLEDSVNSLLSQSYNNIEIVAVVDYLRDNSLKILKQIRKKDKRLRVYANVQNYGLPVTLNRAAKKAHGDYIAFMDSRGKSSIHRIAKQISFLSNNPRVGAVGTQSTILDERGKRLERTSHPRNHKDIIESLIIVPGITFETLMVSRKSLPKDIFNFSKQRYPFLYIDFLLNVARFARIANLKEHLNTVRLSKRDKAKFSFDKKVSLVRLILRSLALYDQKPIIKSVFSPILKQF